MSRVDVCRRSSPKTAVMAVMWRDGIDGIGNDNTITHDANDGTIAAQEGRELARVNRKAQRVGILAPAFLARAQ